MTEKAYIDSVSIDLRILEDEKFSESVAHFFAEQAELCIRERGKFSVALSGGKTPASVLKVLAEKFQAKCDWQRIHFFWSDERAVMPHLDRSNFHMARTHLFDQVNIPDSSIHRVQSELPPETAARLYSEELRHFFQTEKKHEVKFDLIFLGIGEDGHTASLFPGNRALKNDKDLVTAAAIPHVEEERITFTYPLINAARNIAVLVSGEGKRQIVHTTLITPPRPQIFPIQGVHPTNGKLLWFLDQAAASSS